MTQLELAAAGQLHHHLADFMELHYRVVGDTDADRFVQATHFAHLFLVVAQVNRGTGVEEERAWLQSGGSSKGLIENHARESVFVVVRVRREVTVFVVVTRLLLPVVGSCTTTMAGALTLFVCVSQCAAQGTFDGVAVLRAVERHMARLVASITEPLRPAAGTAARSGSTMRRTTVAGALLLVRSVLTSEAHDLVNLCFALLLVAQTLFMVLQVSDHSVEVDG